MLINFFYLESKSLFPSVDSYEPSQYTQQTPNKQRLAAKFTQKKKGIAAKSIFKIPSAMQHHKITHTYIYDSFIYENFQRPILSPY